MKTSIMKTAVCEKYGPPSVAEIKNTEIKEPGPYEVLIPINMIMMNVLFSGSTVRILNLSVTVVFFLFNLIALPGYKSWYDIFLLSFSLIINCLIFQKAF